MIAERIWVRDEYCRWNQMVERIIRREKTRMLTRREKAKREAKLGRKVECYESWHNFAYVNDGETPSWVNDVWGQDPTPNPKSDSDSDSDAGTA